MKHLLLTTIAAVALVGCGELQQSVPSPEVKPVAEAAQPEPPTAKGWTPPVISIHKAAGRGDIEGVKQYLVSGVDVNAKGRFGETPLDWAIDEDRTETADLLRKHGGKHSTINMAAWSGDAKGVKEFLAAGSDVNAKDKYGRTPLHLAAEEGHKEIVELLISKGADLNAKGGRFGRTPLHQAATKEIAELLIAKGADVNAKFESGKLKGQTPLDLANWSNRKQTADLLRKHGGKTGEELKAEGK
jgi:cytohesin